jgi:hypothetical protein
MRFCFTCNCALDFDGTCRVCRPRAPLLELVLWTTVEIQDGAEWYELDFRDHESFSPRVVEIHGVTSGLFGFEYQGDPRFVCVLRQPAPVEVFPAPAHGMVMVAYQPKVRMQVRGVAAGTLVTIVLRGVEVVW